MHAPAAMRFQKCGMRTVSNSRSRARPRVKNRQLLKLWQRLKSAVTAKRLGEPQRWSGWGVKGICWKSKPLIHHVSRSTEEGLNMNGYFVRHYFKSMEFITGAISIDVTTSFISDSSVCMMNAIRDRRPRNHGSIPGMGRFFFSLHSFNTGFGAHAISPVLPGIHISGGKATEAWSRVFNSI